MTMDSTNTPANSFVAVMRKVYRPIGFSKGYNFVLFVIFAGACAGFVLARLQYLDYGSLCGDTGTIPGECHMYDQKDHYKIGIKLHLYTILPGALLACLQFIPIIRRQYPLFHRINGYTSILLSVVSSAGGLMVAPVAFGGSLEIRAFVGLSTIMFLGSLGLGLYNIKRLQIEQHRAWMLRAWFYAGSIITVRFVGAIAAVIISSDAVAPLYHSMPCHKLNSFYEESEKMIESYPSCAEKDAWAAVKADMGGTEEQVAAALNLALCMGVWLALAMHAFGVEVYLRLTPAEFERLREISYQRQVKAGMKNPGRAGLTVDRLGDSARWSPANEIEMEREVPIEHALQVKTV